MWIRREGEGGREREEGEGGRKDTVFDMGTCMEHAEQVCTS